jgi:hypothetical protein
MGDKPVEKPAVERPAEQTEQLQNSEQLSITNQTPTNTVAEGFNNRVTSMSAQMVDSGLMPAVKQSDVTSTAAKAAELFDGKNIGISSDGGRSSGSSISALLKASGADITPTMNIQNLHAQLKDLGWESTELKGVEQLKPGDLVFTGMEPHGRNVGIVGENGKIYSHSMRSNQFEGRTNWSSNFVTVLRPPSDK